MKETRLFFNYTFWFFFYAILALVLFAVCASIFAVVRLV